MRSQLVEDMLHDLAQATGRILCIFEPDMSNLQEVFTLLGLEFDANDVSDSELHSLCHGSQGVFHLIQALSATAPGLPKRRCKVQARTQFLFLRMQASGSFL